MVKTIQQINEKIKEGKAVVVTAEEMIDIVEKEGTRRAAERIDVVTTGTFGPMCSSGAYLNVGQPKPKIKLGGGKTLLNNIPAYAGFAAADIFTCGTTLDNGAAASRIHRGTGAGSMSIMEMKRGLMDLPDPLLHKPAP